MNDYNSPTDAFEFCIGTSFGVLAAYIILSLVYILIGFDIGTFILGNLCILLCQNILMFKEKRRSHFNRTATTGGKK